MELIKIVQNLNDENNKDLMKVLEKSFKCFWMEIYSKITMCNFFSYILSNICLNFNIILKII